jgi:hypothetical protein
MTLALLEVTVMSGLLRRWLLTWTVKRLTMLDLTAWNGLPIQLIRIGWMILTITLFYR